MILHVLAFLTIFLTGADHWTTYLCLREPIAGWFVTEANPLVDWLFHSTGLIEGLWIDSGLTLVTISFLLYTRHFSSRTKHAALSIIMLTTATAVVNNLQAVAMLGISPLGVS